MNNLKSLNNRYETVAWGAILILIGIINLIPGEQNGIFVLGVGMILLGLNLARYIRKIPMNSVTISIGVLAVVIGSIVLLRPVLHIPPINIDLFSLPVLLLFFGIYLLFRAPNRTESE